MRGRPKGRIGIKRAHYLAAMGKPVFLVSLEFHWTNPGDGLAPEWIIAKATSIRSINGFYMPSIFENYWFAYAYANYKNSREKQNG